MSSYIDTKYRIK